MANINFISFLILFPIFRHRHLKPNNFTCGYKNEFESQHAHDAKEHEFHRILRVSYQINFNYVNIISLAHSNYFSIFQYKRSAEIRNVKGPYNSNQQSRYVELLLVVDNKEFKALDENTGKVYRHCKDIANIINSVSNNKCLSITIYIASKVQWLQEIW